MTTAAKVLTRLTLTDANGFDRKEVDIETSIAAILGNAGKREEVSLINGFNALSPPTGAVGVILIPISGAVSWTLKGIAGDTGISIGNGEVPKFPAMIPLDGNPSIGIQCNNPAVVDVYWF